MWTRSDLKGRGKAALKANYGASVIVGIIYLLFVAGSAYSTSRAGSSEEGTALRDSLEALPPDQRRVAAITALSVLFGAGCISLLVKLLLTNPIQVGCCRFFRRNSSMK